MWTFIHLEYFVCLARYRNFSAAARELHVAQPTLSLLIKKLEDELGIQLFVRNTRSVRLTPGGEEFLVWAKRLLRDRELALEATSRYSGLERGRLRVGFIHTSRYHGFLSSIIAFQKHYPGIALELVEDTSDHLIQRLNGGDLDVAIITAPLSQAGSFTFCPLVKDHQVVLMPSAHRLARHEVVEIAELACEPFLIVNASAALKEAFLALCWKSGFTPHIRLESEHVETIRTLVEEELGLSLFSSRIARRLMTPRLTAIPLRPAIPHVTGLAVVEAGRSPALVAFREFVVDRQPLLHPERSLPGV